MIPKLIFLLPGAWWESQMGCRMFRICKLISAYPDVLSWWASKRKVISGKKIPCPTTHLAVGSKRGESHRRHDFWGTDAINSVFWDSGERYKQEICSELPHPLPFNHLFPTFWDSNKLKAALSLTKGEIITMPWVLINPFFYSFHWNISGEFRSINFSSGEVLRYLFYRWGNCSKGQVWLCVQEVTQEVFVRIRNSYWALTCSPKH